MRAFCMYILVNWVPGGQRHGMRKKSYVSVSWTL